MQTVYHETQQILDIMPYSDRFDLARLIVARFQGQDDTPTIRHLLTQQWYAEDLETGEHGIATRLEAADKSYLVWLFQSIANPVPGLVPTTRIVCYGHCQTHQDAVEQQDADAWCELLNTCVEPCELF